MLRLDKFARYPLTFGPTPIEPLPRLSAALGGKVNVFAKRDDCNSGLALGGNKLRKLEYIVPDALACGAIRWSPSAACSPIIRAWSPRPPSSSA